MLGATVARSADALRSLWPSNQRSDDQQQNDDQQNQLLQQQLKQQHQQQSQQQPFSLCNVWLLRFVNVALAALLFRTIRRINETLHVSSSSSSTSLALKSLCDAMCPVVFFFQFLYYTDTGATLFVLLAYEASLRPNNSLRSAMVSDNENTISKLQQQERKQPSFLCYSLLRLRWRFDRPMSCGRRLWPRRVSRANTTHLSNALRQRKKTVNCILYYRVESSSFFVEYFQYNSLVISTVSSLFTFIRRNALSLLRRYAPFVCLGLSFLAFLVANDGAVVLGSTIVFCVLSSLFDVILRYYSFLFPPEL